MSLINFAGEVCAVSQQRLKVNTGIVIQKHTSNSWSKFVTECGLDVAVNTVSNEFVSLSSLKIRERRNINRLQVDDWHLSCWLLLHLLRSSLNLLWGLLLHSWLLLHLRVSLVVVLSLSVLIIVLTLVVMTSVLATSTTSALTSLSSTATASVVVFVSSVVVSHVLILMVLPSLVLLHWVLLHLVVIPLLMPIQ